MPLSRARLVCLVAYLVALAAAAATLAVPIASPFWRVALADVVATLVVFGFSRAFDNSSLYDPYWSVAPMVIVAYWAVEAGLGARGLAVVALVAIWGARLTYNWARGWRGMHHEDWRYVDLRRSTGRFYWPVSLFGIHLFPTVMVLGGLVGAYAAFAYDAPLGPLDALAASVTAGAIAIEALADHQLHRFRAKSPPPDRILDEGLWAWSRHPNYFGEIAFWWGLALFGAAAAGPRPWVFAGAAAITIMFLVVSLPLIDRRMLARRPHYRERIRRVSALVPWPPRR